MTRVAFQGEPGAYSEEAIRRFFPPDTRAEPRRAFEDVGRAVEDGAVEFGLLPIENSLAGSVTQSYDVLASTGLRVGAELVLPIHHCVLGTPGSTVEGLTRLLSHPVALAQCTRFLRQRPDIRAEAVYDTAGAAREVARLADPGVAAIAGAWLARRQPLEVLAANVEDRKDNQTRFLVVARAGASEPALTYAASERTKTALLLEVRNEPGALVEILLPFATRGVNLSKLESRPTGEPWTYRFFLELDADGKEGAAAEALEDVRAHARSLWILGSFRRAVAVIEP